MPQTRLWVLTYRPGEFKTRDLLTNRVGLERDPPTRSFLLLLTTLNLLSPRSSLPSQVRVKSLGGDLGLVNDGSVGLRGSREMTKWLPGLGKRIPDSGCK